MSYSRPLRNVVRRTITLIAAYAIALQAILAGVLPAQAIHPADTAGVICHTASGAAPSTDTEDETGRGGHGSHCTLCAIAPPLPPARSDVARPVLHPTEQLAVAKPAPVVLARPIHSRPGKPRDPPAA